MRNLYSILEAKAMENISTVLLFSFLHFLSNQWKGKPQNMKKPKRALESSVLLSLSLQLFTHFKKPNQKDKSFVSLSVPFLIFPPTKHILKKKKNTLKSASGSREGAMDSGFFSQ